MKDKCKGSGSQGFSLVCSFELMGECPVCGKLVHAYRTKNGYALVRHDLPKSMQRW